MDIGLHGNWPPSCAAGFTAGYGGTILDIGSWRTARTVPTGGREGQLARIFFVGMAQEGGTEVLTRLAARLDEEVAQGRRAALLVPDQSLALKLDTFLWTARESSFLVHELLGPETSPLTPVVLVTAEHSAVTADLLVNFLPTPPPVEQLSKALIVFEMVRQDSAEGLAAGRTRWDWYKNQGLAPQRLVL